jgi:hypothetical protein
LAAVNGCEGIQGPEALPEESDLDDDESSEPGGGIGMEAPGGMFMILGGRCDHARTGQLNIINAAIRLESAAAWPDFPRLLLGGVIGSFFLFG